MATQRIVTGASEMASICQFVEEVSCDLGLDDRLARDLLLAVDEACINVMRHAYDGRGGDVEVTIELADDGVRAVIRDWGVAFDPLSVPVPDVSAPLSERTPGGLGLFLMRNVMDRVEFQFDGDNGNTLTMFRRLEA
jgi:serine/threonine-protein kinase RsbW